MREGLRELAEAHGVATGYLDWAGRPTAVSQQAVLAVLDELGVATSDPAGELRRLRRSRAQALLPATAAATAGTARRLDLAGPATAAALTLEDGSHRRLAVAGAGVALPADLPPGWHTVRVRDASGHWRQAPLVVAPPAVPALARRAWGWAAQLYAVRSAGSWGMGDYADLARLAGWAGAGGADLLLVNPLHATAPAHPVEASPYYPSSRRLPSPLYLRPEALPEYAAASPQVRAQVDALRVRAPGGQLLDRDRVWRAKAAALELLAPVDLDLPPAGPLLEVATFNALAERHGRDFRRWPAGVRPDPRRVAVHGWQLRAALAQLGAAGEAGRAAGLRVGIVHDLAVGVDPGGADAWSLGEVLARGATIGAPPDSFNQQGQDWRMPPWHPHRLAEVGYAPFRDVLDAAMRYGGGIRIDHVLGLFRLWWIPAGAPPSGGTYVHYDSEVLLAVLALQAHRAGVLVIGEDLGTVAEHVAGQLAARGLLGCTVLWFAEGPPARWRAQAAASVTTHDLPTAAGFLAGEHVRLRARLGLLGHSAEEEERAWRRQRAALFELMANERVDAADPVAGLHELLARSPSQVLLAGIADAVGDLRQPNLPGTTDAYPNWRLPLAGPEGAEVSLEELLSHPGPARIAARLRPDPDPDPEPDPDPDPDPDPNPGPDPDPDPDSEQE